MKYEQAREVIQNVLKDNPYLADFYYFMAKTYPDNKAKQIEFLSKSMENANNLTFSEIQVKNELKNLKS